MAQNNSKKSAKAVLKIAGDIIFSVFMIIMTLVIAFSVYYKKTGKQVLPYSVLWVLSNSMEPTFSANSYILVKKVNVNDLEKGDVITFISHEEGISGKLNTHRIEEVVIKGKKFITRGDNYSTPDSSPVYAQDIMYEYVGNMPLLTFFRRIYSTTAGFLFTVVAILLVMLIYFISTVNRISKHKLDKLKQEEIDKLVAEEVERLKREGDKNNNDVFNDKGE